MSKIESSPRNLGNAASTADISASVMGPLRVATWACVLVLAVLSLLPGAEMVRTGLPGHVEHFVAYAGTSVFATAAYGYGRGAWRVIGGLAAYAGLLEALQNFSSGRHPAFADFLASSFGDISGGLTVVVFFYAQVRRSQ